MKVSELIEHLSDHESGQMVVIMDEEGWEYEISDVFDEGHMTIIDVVRDE